MPVSPSPRLCPDLPAGSPLFSRPPMDNRIDTRFKRLFREYGLPSAIRSDNGTPFATQAICGLSRLSVW